MRPRLAIRCDLIADESVPSWVSRLAACNRVRSANEFCLDMGLKFQACANGRPEALVKLSKLTGTSLDALERASIVQSGQNFMLRGERFTKRMLRRLKVRVCPSCLNTDLEVAAATRAHAIYGRTLWQLSVIRTCPIHTCALVPIADSAAHARHDFTLNLRDHQKRIRELAQRPIPQHPSALEAYVMDRLDRRPTGAPWLDHLDLNIAIATCELLGASMTLGATADISTLSDTELHGIGHAGFEVARTGEAGIRAALSQMQASYVSRRTGRTGPRAVFGPIYWSVAHKNRDPGFGPVRDLLRRHIIETMPVGPGDVVLNHRVEKRVLHSIRTAARETGRHPKRLRKILAAAGLIASDHSKYSSRNVLFDAEAARHLLGESDNKISIAAIASYLGSDRRQANMLIRGGYIRPRIDHSGKHDTHRKTYAKRDLDALFGDIYRRAHVTKTYDEPICDVLRAASNSGIPAVDILALIQQGKLSWIGRKPGPTGYPSVLVDSSEIKRIVWGSGSEGVTMADATASLATSRSVVVALVREGYLSQSAASRPASSRGLRMVDRQSLEEFQRTYVSFTELCRTRKLRYTDIIDRLKDTPPAIDRTSVGATYYLRERLPDL